MRIRDVALALDLADDAEVPMTHERWLLERAVAMLDVLMTERAHRGLVSLPPEGAKLLEIERAALVAALERTNWNQAAAAKLISITPRVMHYKVRRYGLHGESPHMRRSKGGHPPKGPTKPPPRKAGKDWRTQPWQGV